MNTQTSYRSKLRQSGLAIVEFAVTMPLVLLLLCGTAEIGRALYQYNALTKAVRDGARYLANKGAVVANNLVINDSDLTGAINLTVYGSPIDTGPAILPGFIPKNVTAQVSGLRDVEVTATYKFVPVFANIPNFGFGSGAGLKITTFTASSIQRSLR